MGYFIVGLICLLAGGVLDHFFGQKVEKNAFGQVTKVYHKGEEFVRKHI